MRNLDKFSLSDCIKAIKDIDYCIIKYRGKLTDYEVGNDIDIFTTQHQNLIYILNEKLISFVSNGGIIKVTDYKEKIHFDLFDNGNFYFRFDICVKPPKYSNLLIKDSFFYSCIFNSEEKETQESNIKIPNKFDDLILRYIEFLDLYNTRPDKISHVDYINEIIQQSNIDKGLFDKRLFEILSIKLDSIDSNASKFSRSKLSYLKKNLITAFNYYKIYGFYKLVKKVWAKIL
jgi:hypothetical protein